MAVELDLFNREGSLSPRMVPKASVVTTTERTFVIRGQGGKAECVNAAKGAADRNLIEVAGKLQAGAQASRFTSERAE